MIIPPLCQSCGQPIGHLWDIYKALVQKYAEETGQISSVEEAMSRQTGVKKRGRGRPKKTSNEDKTGTAKGQGSNDQSQSPEYRALAELAEKHGFNPERYCCRFMFLCNHDISDVVH